MDHLLFDGWTPVLRTFIGGVLAYVALVMLLRASGQRTLSKMNAFDFVVTIALGSTMATILTAKDVSFVQGVAAFGLLIAMQFVVTWLGVRVAWWRRFMTGDPRLLFYDGEFLAAAMRDARVTEADVLAAIRAAGYGDRSGIGAVVLETNATFSVIIHGSTDDGSSLAGLDRSES